MNVQHVNIKIFAADASINLADAIPVFHRWIQENVCEELMVDVADYRHVPAGPGVMLIGHEANYSLDCAGNRLGLLYNRKSAADGSTPDKLLQAFGAALMACRRLEEEPTFKGRLRFDDGHFEIILNDRLLTPNTEETWTALKGEIETFLAGLLAPEKYEVERQGDPRARFQVEVRTEHPLDRRLA